MALSKGGLCISDAFFKVNEYLQWRCSLGHEWGATFSNVVQNNRWCPECVGILSPQQLLKKANDYATLNKGTGLTQNIPLAKTKLEWKCADPTHKPWKLSYSAIVGNKSWCPECVHGKYYKENIFKSILEIMLGFPLEKAYPQWNINPKTKKNLEFDGYNEEHKFAFEFQGGYHKKAIFKNQDVANIQFKDQQKVINCQKEGVTLLVIHDNKAFSNINTCIETVKSELTNLNISFNNAINEAELHEKIWMKNRTNEKIDRLKKLKNLAIKKGGKCLSEHYFNVKNKMSFKCSNPSHSSWEASYDQIFNQGTWCKQCYLEGRQKNKK